MSEQDFNNQEPVNNTPDTSTPEPTEKYIPRSDGHRISIRDHLKHAVETHKASDRSNRYRSENEDELKAVQHGEEPDTGETPTETEQTEHTEQPEEPQTAKPPSSWSRQAKEFWAETPDQVKAEVWRREGDSEKGVKQLKQKYAEIDAVHNKLKPTLDKAGLPFKDFVEGAGGYHLAMMGPQRLQVAAQLLQQYGIHPSQLLPPGQQQPQQNGQVDPRDQYLLQMAQKLDYFEQQQKAAEHNTALTYVENVGKQMPHFEEVRGEMAEQIKAGKVKTDENGNPDLWDAYNRAIRMNDTIWDQVQQEKAQKAAAKKKADAEAKKRAGNGSIPPNSFGNVNGAARDPLKGSSIGTYLRAAAREHGWKV